MSRAMGGDSASPEMTFFVISWAEVRAASFVADSNWMSVSACGYALLPPLGDISWSARAAHSPAFSAEIFAITDMSDSP